jgi:hypothetical protein
MKQANLPKEGTYQEYNDLARDYAGQIARGEVKAPKLLTMRSAKIDKSGGAGFLSVILHLEPATRFEGAAFSFHSCLWATAGCIKACLRYGGRMRFSGSMFARLWRSWLLADHPEIFWKMLAKEIRVSEKRARRLGLGFTVRLNGTSDLTWESILFQGRSIFEHFPGVQFYDYTKSPDRPIEVRIANYHLVYSHSEKSDPIREGEILARGGSIATVFDLRGGKDLPSHHEINGVRYPVINGDLTDLRHLDPRGVIVGLKYKLAFSKRTKKAIAPPAGFVVKINRVSAEKGA